MREEEGWIPFARSRHVGSGVLLLGNALGHTAPAGTCILPQHKGHIEIVMDATEGGSMLPSTRGGEARGGGRGCSINKGYATAPSRRCANLGTGGCFLLHLLQPKVRGVHRDCRDVLALAQEGAQHSQDVHCTDLVPVQVHNGQSVGFIRVWDVLIRICSHGSYTPLSFKSVVLQSRCYTLFTLLLMLLHDLDTMLQKHADIVQKPPPAVTLPHGV